MKGAMILMLLLLYPVLVIARVSTRSTNRRPSRDSNEHLLVTAKTGTQAHADTDDAVYLYLFGAERNSPGLRLNTPAGDFERGAVDMFNLSTPYVPDIEYVKLKIGGNDGWFVEDVTLEWVSVDQTPIVFNFTSWLDQKRFLFAYSPLQETADFRVKVKTGVTLFAGTDEIVTITLYSGSRHTYPYILDKDGYDDFERDSLDIFNLTTEYIGEITNFTWTSGDGDKWLLDWIEVQPAKAGWALRKNVYQWYH